MTVIIIINAGNKVWRHKNPNPQRKKKKTKQKYSVLTFPEAVLQESQILS